MKPSDCGAVTKRLIAIQLAMLASLAAFYFFYLPCRTKSQTAAKAQEHELRIEALFQSLVVEDARDEVELPGTGGKVRVHPQKLNRMPAVDEVVQALGLPKPWLASGTSTVRPLSSKCRSWRSLRRLVNNGRLARTYCV